MCLVWMPPVSILGFRRCSSDFCGTGKGGACVFPVLFEILYLFPPHLFLPLFFFIASSNHRGSYGRRSLGRPRVHENISLYKAGLPNAQALGADQEALVNTGGMRQKLQATGFFLEASLTVTQYEEEKNWYAFKPRGQTAHTT